MGPCALQSRIPALAATLAAFAAACLATPCSVHAAPLATTFTYQGELRNDGSPSEGPHDFQVALYAAASGGGEIVTVDVPDATVTQGLFSLALDFTAVPFEQAVQYWLELRVRGGAEHGAYTPLQPRQALTATPYALSAVTALGVLPGSIGATAIDPHDVQRRIAADCGDGKAIRAVGMDGSVTCEIDDAPLGLRDYERVSVDMEYFGGPGVPSGVGLEARCPAGKVAIGGGVHTGCSAAYVRGSYPITVAGNLSWFGEVVKPAAGFCEFNPPKMTVYAICARVN